MYLDFISDEALENAVSHVFQSFTKAVVETDIHKNTLDPFSAFLEASFANDSFDGWALKEKQRQSQKTFQNAIGDFHQMVLGSFPTWRNLGTGGGLDVCSDKMKMLAEIKNKHNTMNSSSALEVYDKITEMLSLEQYNDYTGYCVKIIPKSSKGIPPTEFTPSDAKTKRKRIKNPRILQIDGKRFYALASGDTDAMEKVYDALPSVISKLRNTNLSVQEIANFKKVFKLIF